MLPIPILDLSKFSIKNSKHSHKTYSSLTLYHGKTNWDVQFDNMKT